MAERNWADYVSNPSAALPTTPVEQNRDPLADALGIDPADLAGLDMGGVGPMGEDPIEAALAEAALEVSGIDLFSYGEGARIPHWVPRSLRKYMRAPSEPLKGVYDPYHGFVDTKGDERVYMGAELVSPRQRGQGDAEPSGLTPSEARAAGRDHNDRRQAGMSAEGMTPSEARAAGLDHNDYPKKKKRSATLTYQQAVNLPYSWEDEEVADAMKRFRKAGVNVTNFDQLMQAWGGLVDRASKTYTNSLGERKVTPWDVLEMSKREAKLSGSLVDYESGTQNRTSTSVTEISEGASWAALRTTLSQLLGRDPTDREVRDYTYRMNTLAAKNPSISETVTRYQAGEQVSSNTTTTGGFDADDMAREAYDQAQDDPEYAKVQGGTTYFNSLMQALGAVGDV